MSQEQDQNNSGVLYVVATPIGNLDDMTPRAITVLQSVDTILAEDTRHSGGLLKKFGITTPAKACHDHNERNVAPAIIERLKAGENIALISDAGTPLISDPGYHLIQLAQQSEINVTPIPGASALITALSASGLPSDRFTFNGFLPPKQKARQKKLEELKSGMATQIFYEAPHRLANCITDLKEIFGSDRKACIARELTKVYETIYTDTLIELDQWLTDNPNQCRGEIVIIAEGGREEKTDGEDQRVLKILLDYLTPSQAVAATVKITDGKKNHLYKIAQEHANKHSKE